MKIELSKNQEGAIFMNVKIGTLDTSYSTNENELLDLAAICLAITRGPCTEASWWAHEKDV